MRKLPAAFAVFRIQPPAEFSACRQLILTGEHLVADVCLHLKVRPIAPERRPECP